MVWMSSDDTGVLYCSGGRLTRFRGDVLSSENVLILWKNV